MAKPPATSSRLRVPVRTARTDQALAPLGVLSLNPGSPRLAHRGHHIIRVKQHDRLFAEGVRNDLGGPALLAEHPLQKVGGAGDAAMSGRQPQVRDASMDAR